jgi:hypothetical protein
METYQEDKTFSRNKSESAQKSFMAIKSNRLIFGADSILQELEHARNQMKLNRTSTMAANSSTKRGLMQRGKFPYPSASGMMALP